MTPHIEHNPHIRELIRSFARIDECFDDDLTARTTAEAPFRDLNARLESLLSFPLIQVKDAEGERGETFSVHQLQQIGKRLPVVNDGAQMDTLPLRERLRDKLYECLLRMDHCTPEQLAARRIVLSPSLQLSLNNVHQLVMLMISECLMDFNEAVSDCTEPAL